MDGYYRADLEGNLIMVNPQTVNMLGYDRDDELKGVNLARDVYAYPKDRRPLVEQLRKKGYVKGFTATLVKKNGEHIDIEANSRLIRDKKGDPVAVEGVIRDVTERNRYARRLEEARLEAEAANMAKSEFLANMSHEIRTPLNGVLGMLQLLEGTRLDDEQKKYLHIALNSGRSLLGLISDILDLSKVEAGKIEVVNEPFRLDEVLESVTGSFRHQARLKNIDLKCKCPEDMHLTYFGDEKRLKQILFNLVGNAVKFTESGEVECEVTSLGKSESDEDRLLLIVRDSGEGIEEYDFQRIFEPFTQANGSYNRKYQGTGLGLTIVKRLVDLMGGAIDVESQVGGGTTVYLRLDLQPAEKPVEQVDEAEAEDLPRIKVLVVEDNLVNRMTVARMLQKLGLEALEAEDGEQALTVLEEETPDLVFMDVQMPNMDGIEATRAVRSGAVNGVPADLPIVALTAHAMAGDKEKFLDAGMDDYIAKPVDMGKLTEIVRRFSGRKSL
jgi:PAS domain S-box-containing protein